MSSATTTVPADILPSSPQGIAVLLTPTTVTLPLTSVQEKIPAAVYIGDVHVPIEVVERFIDCLRDDGTAMCQCALVCQSWNIRSTFNIYGSIHIAEWRTLHALLRSSRQHVRVRTRLKTMTEELVIHETHSSDWMATGKERGSLSTAVLLALAHFTASIRHLHFKGLIPPAHPSFYVGLIQLNTVTELTITGTESSSIQLARVISAFPQLRRLSVHTPPHDIIGCPNWVT